MDHINSISFIGSGNVATHLAIAIKKAGYDVKEIYSLNHENAIELARKVGCKAIKSIEQIDQSVDLFLIAVPDETIEKVIENFPLVDGIVAHTSGITPMEVLKREPRFGVFYPLQTFSKQRELDISAVPFCIEASSEDVLIQLKEIALKLSKSVFEITGFLKKLPLLPIMFGFGNFCCLMEMTALEISEIFGFDIWNFLSSVAIAP